MSTSALNPAAFTSTGDHVIARTRPAVSWTIWAGVVGVTSASIGGAWDVSWHRSIGRDAFLTPAHLAIYACGILAAVVCGYLMLYTTFGGSAQLKAESVHVLGFRAPLGAFIAAWGGFAMLTSAPFDNWWHAAYGLDVKIISPPHVLLILGIRAITVGILFLILAAMNRSGSLVSARPEAAATHRQLQFLFLYLGGLIVAGQMFFLIENTWDVFLHNSLAYRTMAMALPIAFAVISRASGYKWSATVTASIYMAMGLLEILILPLFPASPKLGPVYFPVTHFVPAKFPILIVAPAFALDLLWNRLRSWKAWQLALISGVVFTVVLVAVEWPFANFLMSKASENRFFGTIYFDFNSRPDGVDRLRQFLKPEHGLALYNGLLLASVYGSISTWLGLKFGSWMRGVQR